MDVIQYWISDRFVWIPFYALLLAGIIIMLGRVPVGSLITPWMVMYLLVFVVTIFMANYFKDRKIIFGSFVIGLLGVTVLGINMDWNPTEPAIFFLPSLQEWIYTVPNLAGARAIMIGIGAVEASSTARNTCICLLLAVPLKKCKLG